jgi:hypothetical protein
MKIRNQSALGLHCSKTQVEESRSKGSVEPPSKTERQDLICPKKSNNFTKLNKQSTMLYLNHHPANGAVMDNFMKSSHGSFKVPAQRNNIFDKVK